MPKPVVFSGIQPTGNLHVVNYLGAVKNWVELQNSGKYDCYFCIVDYHSMTGSMTAEERREQTLVTAAELMALGLGGEKSTLFVQSHVPEHTELGWMFATVTPVNELFRMTQFKDKSGGAVVEHFWQKEKQEILSKYNPGNRELGTLEHTLDFAIAKYAAIRNEIERQSNVGLLTYPILQAADVLLYHGTLVPVGQDQVQHIELMRDIARWFNHRYGDYFPEAKPLLTEIPKVMSLIEPMKKMSKSLGTGHVIEIGEEPEQIETKLKKAVTATEGGGFAPGAENLLNLLKHFGDAKLYKQFMVAEKSGGIRYGDLKKAVGESIAQYFTDFRARRAALLKNPEQVTVALAAGAEKARSVAEKTMQEVRERVGIR